MLLAGRITGAYGIKGWVKVHPYTDSPETFLEFGQWTLQWPSRAAAPEQAKKTAEAAENPAAGKQRGSETRAGNRRGARSVHFLEGRPHGKGLIARIDGVSDRDAAEALRGAEVWVDDGLLPDLEQGEYYWHQLQGLRVYCDHQGSRHLLGVVDHLLETGANDVLVIRPCEGSLDERERLIPFVEGDVVTAISLDEGQIRVTWHPDD